MEQNEDPNQMMEFVRKNRSYFIAGLVVILAVILLTTRKTDEASDRNEQTSAESTGETKMDGENAEAKADEQNQNSNQSTASGNVSANGTLRLSDNTAKGNYVIDSNRGKVYIQTKRNFSNLVDKQVTLQAEGTLSSFTFLGFAEGGAVAPDTSKSAEQGNTVSVSGELRKSDNNARGNYVIHSSSGHVYLQTAHDYSSWVGSEVNLIAKGTINSFSGAVVTKK